MKRPVIVHLIAAARPNFMKVAPLFHALKKEAWCDPRIVHTGQHYDPAMSDAFFADLRMPRPDYSLGVGSGTHAEQTAGVMIAYERICMEQRPDWVVVVGDVNSTLACAIAAKKLCLPVAHLEAGLRSRDRTMPEEINRLVTDAISDLLWTPSSDADENLRNEGVPEGKIVRVGNIMIDSFEMLREKIEGDDTARRLGLGGIRFAVATFHRPVNVDSPERLARLAAGLSGIGLRLPVVFPVHPRTRNRLEAFGLWAGLSGAEGVRAVEPMGYVGFMNLVQQAALVMTDSGGVQEETTYLGIPCLTVRESTERPVTVTEGTNRLIRIEDMEGSAEAVLAGSHPRGSRPDRWDGRTASRIVDSLKQAIHAG
jgi:UDP-N-acetylglucosamine 2-epimerase (non-hydrolysing)